MRKSIAPPEDPRHQRLQPRPMTSASVRAAKRDCALARIANDIEGDWAGDLHVKDGMDAIAVLVERYGVERVHRWLWNEAALRGADLPCGGME